MVKDVLVEELTNLLENAIQKLDIIVNGDGNERLDFTYIEDLVDGISML